MSTGTRSRASKRSNKITMNNYNCQVLTPTNNPQISSFSSYPQKSSNICSVSNFNSTEDCSVNGVEMKETSLIISQPSPNKDLMLRESAQNYFLRKPSKTSRSSPIPTSEEPLESIVSLQDLTSSRGSHYIDDKRDNRYN